MAMRMIVDDMKAHEQAGLGSPGIDELRWLKPVYPGDTLRCESEVLSKRRSASRHELGLFASKPTVLNQHDERVMTQRSTGLSRVSEPQQSALRGLAGLGRRRRPLGRRTGAPAHRCALR